MTSPAEAAFERMHAAQDPAPSSGMMEDYMRTGSGSMKISGRDLLDILNAFTADPVPGETFPGPVKGLDDAGFQEKDNSQPVNTIQPQANMFQQFTSVQKLGRSSKRYQELGRCPPTGGAFPQFFAPGYDDFGYGAPSMMHDQAPAAGQAPGAPAGVPVPNPMAFDNILLSGKKIAGLAMGGPKPPGGQPLPPGARPSKTQPLKKNQARTGYQHKKRKPHPVVEKARRDGINMLIEELRDIVPEGGWKAGGHGAQFRKTTSLRDALETIHGGAVGVKVDKRTKRAVLMDAIASIETLQQHAKTLADQMEVLGKAAGEAHSPSFKSGDSAYDGERSASLSGDPMEEGAMKKVEVEVSPREASPGPSEPDAEAPAATPLTVKISYFDRRGFLADECVAMRHLGLTIKTAELPKPSRAGWVQDSFDVTSEEDCSTIEQRHELESHLLEALDETQCLYYQGQRTGEKRART